MVRIYTFAYVYKPPLGTHEVIIVWVTDLKNMDFNVTNSASHKVKIFIAKPSVRYL